MVDIVVPWNTVHTLYFPLQGSATLALSTLASGSLSGTNIQVSVDGAGFVDSTNTGTALPGLGWYRLIVHQTETTGTQFMVKIAGGTLGTVVEEQNYIFKTFGSANAFYPGNVLGTVLSDMTVGTVGLLLTGTVSTVTGVIGSVS